MLNYITKQNLPGDLLGNLEAATANAGADFLSGNSSVVGREVGILNNASVIAGTVTDPALYDKITKDLLDYSVKITKEELTAYISDRTSELLNFNNMTGVLADSVAYWTKVKTLSPGEVLAAVQTKNVKEEAQKEQEKQKTSTISNIKDSGTATVGAAVEYVDNTINALDAGIASITAYVSRGPDWVIENTNKYVSLGIHKAETFIGEQVDTALRARNAAIDALGQGLGTSAAEVINQMSITAAKKSKSAAEAGVSQVQIKAMNAITKAIMMVRQITGVAVPVVYPESTKLTDLF